MKHIVVLVTCANKKEAGNIAKTLVQKRIAACVNIVDGIESFFWWKAKLDSAKETLLIIKSQGKNLQKIIRQVKALHSYEVPEIIALPIISGEKNYLAWLNNP